MYSSPGPNDTRDIEYDSLEWGRSSDGRASRSQCEGREFDPPRLHHLNQRVIVDPRVNLEASKWDVDTM